MAVRKARAKADSDRYPTRAAALETVASVERSNSAAAGYRIAVARENVAAIVAMPRAYTHASSTEAFDEVLAVIVG